MSLARFGFIFFALVTLAISPTAFEVEAFQGFTHPKGSPLACRTACHQPENLHRAQRDKQDNPQCRACHQADPRSAAGPFLEPANAVFQAGDALPNRRRQSLRPASPASQPSSAAKSPATAPAPVPPPDMALVPAGEFIMGSNERWDDESPDHISQTGDFF
ncbi:MAG: formylglycine-generating enzyme family protein, partial [Nitrospinaceae bacterium]